MNLSELLQGIVIDGAIPHNGLPIKGIALDSRKVKKRFVFMALKGAVQHGLDYANQAITNGALAVIYDVQDKALLPQHPFNSDWLGVKELSSQLSHIAHRFYQMPSDKITVIGITGTNGKTTCSHFLAQMLTNCGVIGTLGYGSADSPTLDTLQTTVNTTPDALTTQAILAEFVEAQKQTVAMEVSSHGLQQGRVNAVNFKGAVLTNLSHDHLDYHANMNDYLKAKLLLFRQPRLDFVVVNIDDEKSDAFLEAVNKTHKKTECWAYSATGKKLENIESVTADAVKCGLRTSTFLLCWRQQKIQITTRIIGDFNVENILAVATVWLALGHTFSELAHKITALTPIVGRMEKFGGGNKPIVLVDYAHNPDALDKVLHTVKKICRGQLWVVFGCGGNRDKGKRLQMGAIASRLANQVIITNDNPRLENPEAIIKDILQGCTSNVYAVIQDRGQAIQTAIRQAGHQDYIVIAGKGHEHYFNAETHEHASQPTRFSDQYFVKESLLN